jgi:predicted alpha/beta hydrolase family esterase
MSGDLRRLHRVHGVCSGSPENHWVTRLSHKTEAEDSTRRCGQPKPVQPPRRDGQTAWAGQIARAGLTAQGGGLTVLVASAEILRCEGHALGSQVLRGA